jgi:hypothetical protein
MKTISKVNTLHDIANKIAELVRPSRIAETLKISPAELEPLLAQAVVLGHIRRSDILFTFPQSICDEVENLHVKRGIIPAKIHIYFRNFQEDIDECETNILCALIKQRVVYADLYDMVSEIERTLHKRIRQCLEEAFRNPEDAWWSKGVPLAVRKSCATRKEEDKNPSDDPYVYTTLIELKAIIEGTIGGKSNWNVFSKRLPKGAQDKQQILDNLDRLNSIRNRIMHPVRPDEPLGETEYRLVSQIRNTLVSSPWNLKTHPK